LAGGARLTRSGGAASVAAVAETAAHHDVLQCRSCGRTAEVDRVGPLEPRPDPDHAGGFVVDEAEVVFRGLCPDCR
jgi:Fur family transcriptional regulator, stress-responsive regulator